MNNIDTSADAQLNFSLNTLRTLNFNGEIKSGQHIVPGIYFSVDPKSSDVIEIDTAPGEMMSLRIKSPGPSRWLTLNMSFGGSDLDECSILGFMLKSESLASMTLRASLRSGTDSGHIDHSFSKTIVSFPKSSVHLDMIELGKNPDLPTKARWRELIFFLRREDSEICFKDMRVFAV